MEEWKKKAATTFIWDNGKPNSISPYILAIWLRGVKMSHFLWNCWAAQLCSLTFFFSEKVNPHGCFKALTEACWETSYTQIAAKMSVTTKIYNNEACRRIRWGLSNVSTLCRRTLMDLVGELHELRTIKNKETRGLSWTKEWMVGAEYQCWRYYNYRIENQTLQLRSVYSPRNCRWGCTT